MSDRAINTTWFREKLAEKELSQRGLAKLMGLDSAAVSLMLRGKREMRIAEAAMIANFLGVSTEEILHHVGPAVDGPSPVPIIGTVNGSSGRVKWGEGLGEVPRPVGDLPLNVAAIQCRTSGTVLDYMDRWVLFIPQPHDSRHVRPECIERLSLVRPSGGDSMLAVVRRGYAPGRWNLRGPVINAEETELDYAAPILLITT